MPGGLVVDGARLLADLASLAEEGRTVAPPGALSGAPGGVAAGAPAGAAAGAPMASGGWTRPALGDADARARAKVIARMRAAGMAVRHDEVGNVRARRRGRRPELP